jgi:hypothetical protein
MAKKVRPGVGAPGAVDSADTDDGQHSTKNPPQGKPQKICVLHTAGGAAP